MAHAQTHLMPHEGVAPAMFPWFTEARKWVSMLAHALFGAVAAGTCVALHKPRAPCSDRAV